MIIPKQNLLIISILLHSSIAFSQQNSLNAGLSLFEVKNNNPYGGGVHLGYEYHIPKLNFLALEARLSGGKLIGDGLYQVNPIKEWDYSVNYFMVGIIPRIYCRLSEDFGLFVDAEIGITRISGKTYFSEESNWKATKTFNYNYYAIKVGMIAAISEKLKISTALGYMPLDITNLMNSNLPNVSYRFKNQNIDLATSFTFHIIL